MQTQRDELGPQYEEMVGSVNDLETSIELLEQEMIGMIFSAANVQSQSKQDEFVI